jgi:hypothetical protein
MIQADFLQLGPQRLNMRATDRLPSIIAQVIDDQGVAVDLTEARVYMTTRRVVGVADPERGYDWSNILQVVIVDAPIGVIYYDLQPGDTDANPGEFELMVLVVFPDGTQLNVPTVSNCRIVVRDNVHPQITEAYLRKSDDTIITTKDDVRLIVQVDTHLPPSPVIGSLIR